MIMNHCADRAAVSGQTVTHSICICICICCLLVLVPTLVSHLLRDARPMGAPLGGKNNRHASVLVKARKSRFHSRDALGANHRSARLAFCGGWPVGETRDPLPSDFASAEEPRAHSCITAASRLGIVQRDREGTRLVRAVLLCDEIYRQRWFSPEK